MDLGYQGGPLGDIGATNLPQVTPQTPGFWDKIGQNIDPISIALDQVGSRIAPNNPFAGVGTGLAKSSIANKAHQEMQNRIIKELGGLMDKGDPSSSLMIKTNPDGSMTYTKKSELAGPNPTLEDNTIRTPEESENDPVFNILKQYSVGGQ